MDPAVVRHHAWRTQFTIIKVESLLRKCFVTVILSKLKEQHAWCQVLPPHVAGDGAAEELGGGEEAGAEDQQEDGVAVVQPEHTVVDRHLLLLRQPPEVAEEAIEGHAGGGEQGRPEGLRTACERVRAT